MTILKPRIPILFTLVLWIVSSSLDSVARDFFYRYGSHTLQYTVISEEKKTCMTKEGLSLPNGLSEPGNEVSGNVTIPEIVNDGVDNFTVVEVGKLSFLKDSRLNSIVLPNTIKRIGERAFELCSNLEEISIPDSLKILEDYAFSGTKIRTFNIPFTVNRLGESVFNGCQYLTSIVIPYGVTYIPDYAFFNCYNLEEIVIPNSVMTIGKQAFLNCHALKSVFIPNSVYQIGNNAFDGCYALTSVIIGRGVEYFGDINGKSYMFKNCRNLKTIVSLPTTPPAYSSYYSDTFISVPSNAVIYVPKGSLNNYKSWNFSTVQEITVPVYGFEQNTMNIKVGESQLVKIIRSKTTECATEGVSNTSNYNYKIVDLQYERSVTDFSYNHIMEYRITGLASGNQLIKCWMEDDNGLRFWDYCYVSVSDDKSGMVDLIFDENHEDCAIKYYNLNGVQVESKPLTPGIYLKVLNGKTEKIMIR